MCKIKSNFYSAYRNVCLESRVLDFYIFLPLWYADHPIGYESSSAIRGNGKEEVSCPTLQHVVCKLEPLPASIFFSIRLLCLIVVVVTGPRRPQRTGGLELICSFCIGKRKFCLKKITVFHNSRFLIKVFWIYLQIYFQVDSTVIFLCYLCKVCSLAGPWESLWQKACLTSRLLPRWIVKGHSISQGRGSVALGMPNSFLM